MLCYTAPPDFAFVTAFDESERGGKGTGRTKGKGDGRFSRLNAGGARVFFGGDDEKVEGHLMGMVVKVAVLRGEGVVMVVVPRWGRGRALTLSVCMMRTSRNRRSDCFELFSGLLGRSRRCRGDGR